LSSYPQKTVLLTPSSKKRERERERERERGRERENHTESQRVLMEGGMMEKEGRQTIPNKREDYWGWRMEPERWGGGGGSEDGGG
jgi:hypothetical protein